MTLTPAMGHSGRAPEMLIVHSFSAGGTGILSGMDTVPVPMGLFYGFHIVIK